MSELINNGNDKRQAILKRIIKDLHAGVPVEELQKTFAELIRSTSPEEIANMENALIKEGFPPSEIQRLCDVHAQVFEESLAKVGKPSKMPGHPVNTYILENEEARVILGQLSKAAKGFKKGKPSDEDIADFKEGFIRLKEIEKHYQRKENQLFPVLETKKFTGPTQVMWGKHDEIRDHIRGATSLMENGEWKDLYKRFKKLKSAIEKLMFLEEKILFPTAIKMLDEQEWAEIKKGGPDIGYAWVTPSNLWDAELAKSGAGASASEDAEEKKEAPSTGGIDLSRGKLSSEQLDLMLKSLPVDITFVDENDRVCYYSESKERIFPRSPAIIGRAVQNCHPPASVHVVNDIVQSFREKKKDVAEFWIQLHGKFIHIRYFPVFSDEGAYRGVIEVSQDVTDIRALEGERRILDWE
jgi:DUF438 domain-containing protein